mmetsp:Transcript_21096/g.66636  ORF Transcript_21096/g.66636 Transcript_21096/m.66636 type:complete len:323 (-) Transcript_21096:473-1441(-)
MPGSARAAAKSPNRSSCSEESTSEPCISGSAKLGGAGGGRTAGGGDLAPGGSASSAGDAGVTENAGDTVELAEVGTVAAPLTASVGGGAGLLGVAMAEAAFSKRGVGPPVGPLCACCTGTRRSMAGMRRPSVRCASGRDGVSACGGRRWGRQVGTEEEPPLADMGGDMKVDGYAGVCPPGRRYPADRPRAVLLPSLPRAVLLPSALREAVSMPAACGLWRLAAGTALPTTQPLDVPGVEAPAAGLAPAGTATQNTGEPDRCRAVWLGTARAVRGCEYVLGDSSRGRCGCGCVRGCGGDRALKTGGGDWRPPRWVRGAPRSCT